MHPETGCFFRTRMAVVFVPSLCTRESRRVTSPSAKRVCDLLYVKQGEIGMSFRGINTTVIQIRRQVFTEVARMAYANVKGEGLLPV